MRDLVRAGYLAHAQSPVYRRHLERAATIGARWPDQGSYVGFSGGKDSQALLGLVLEQWPDARAQILTAVRRRCCTVTSTRYWPGGATLSGLRLTGCDRVWSTAQDATWYEAVHHVHR